MPLRVVGIDPGTRSFDIFGLEDEHVMVDVSIPSEDVALNPRLLVDLLHSLEPLDLVVGPSGYGIPLKHISEISGEDLFLMTLVRPDDRDIPVLVGLSRVVQELKKYAFNIYFIPGVIHLPTVPPHRKVNSIDLGTADKLCVAALAVYDYSRRHGVPFRDPSILVVEVGYGYNAAIAVEHGVIVDGVGGTKAGPGFLTAGGLDGEVAYLLGTLRKDMLFKGGVKSIAGTEVEPEDFHRLTQSSRSVKIAWDAFIEGIEKTVWSLTPVLGKVDAILLSGRLSRVEPIYNELSKRLKRIAQVERIKGFGAKSKEAAQGAALIANGLAGGFAKELVEHLKIRESSGTVLDHVYIEDLKEKIIGHRV
ncbi:butyrate kinase [Candidatus Calditenuaceae archaeon HR02]|nr:butyrate kinase [Candidatus Calditenuaceae archaeon HR02]